MIELDFYRLSFPEVLRHLEYGQDSKNPMSKFLMALVTRLGRQPSLLWLGPDGQPSRRQAHALPERTVCQGCANCKGADWLLKTQIVAHLWTICCEWPDVSCFMST